MSEVLGIARSIAVTRFREAGFLGFCWMADISPSQSLASEVVSARPSVRV